MDQFFVQREKQPDLNNHRERAPAQDIAHDTSAILARTDFFFVLPALLGDVFVLIHIKLVFVGALK